MRAAIIVVALALAAPAEAQNPQLVNTVRIELRRLGFDVDMDTLSASQIVALHFELNSRRDGRSSQVDRNKIRAILNRR